MENDPAKEAGVDPAEQDSAVTENDPKSNELTEKAETQLTDNGPVSDTQESRDPNGPNE